LQLLLVLALAFTAAPAAAQQVTVKLGTLAPQGSTWHKILLEMGQKWAEASNGRVKLRIYPGGAQGSEGDMVRKMGVGQLQAAAISNVGMHDIVKEPQAISAPGMIENGQELHAVLSKLEPKLDALLDARGFIALQWSEIGALKLFCAKPYRTPAEMSDAKMFAWDGDPSSVEAWKAAGFRPVVLSSTDIVPSLQTGMINCIANVPLYVLTARLFERADNMMDVNWGFLVGATVIKKDAWEKIPADLRPKLLAIARELGNKVDAEVKRLNDEAVAAMKKQGLNVVAADAAAWRASAEKAWPVVRGGVVPAEFFDQVVKARDEYRRSTKK
jgi:TRAP-type C4-dicarboxylate transport system substrate-binding protein